MKYLVKNFELVSGMNGNLLIAPSITVKITDQLMIDFLFQIIPEINNTLTKKNIHLLLENSNIDRNTGVEFLTATGVLESTQDKTSPFQQVILVCDNPQRGEYLMDAMEYDGVKYKVTIDTKNLNKKMDYKNALFVIFLEEYNPQVIRELYKKYATKKNGTGFIQAYFYFKEFRIDGLYMPDIGTPCHFCHFERFISREKISFSDNQFSWMNLVKHLNQEDIYPPLTMRLQETDYLYSIHILRRRLQQLVGTPVAKIHLDEFISSIYSDLISCRTNREPIPHWHACDCVKGLF